MINKLNKQEKYLIAGGAKYKELKSNWKLEELCSRYPEDKICRDYFETLDNQKKAEKKKNEL